MEIENNMKIDNENNSDILQDFTEEELVNAEIYNPNIDYRKELCEKYKDYKEEDYNGIDDFVEDTDKIALIRYCNHIIKTNYKEYPSIMEEILTKKMYYDTIKNMNKEDYLEEKRNINKLSPIDKELQKIKDEDNLEYALNQLKKD